MKIIKMKQTGFTLVELVLVISIVVVLSVISGPIYRSYAYKARQAEGYALIGTIRSAQESYYGEYGEFLHCSNSSAGSNLFTCNDEVLGIDARPNKYYTYFGVGGKTQADGTSLPNTKYAFVARAWSNVAASLHLYYNRTAGVTVAVGSSTSNVQIQD